LRFPNLRGNFGSCPLIPARLLKLPQFGDTTRNAAKQSARREGLHTHFGHVPELLCIAVGVYVVALLFA